MAPDPGPLTTFTVVDASSDPDTPLGSPVDGGTLTLAGLAGLAGDSYGIRVDTDSNHDDHDDIHKVALALSGRKDVNKPEWEAPYSLYGDDGQDNLKGESLPAGGYELKATVYRANGDVLGTLQVSFEVAYAALAQQQTEPPPAPNSRATGAPTHRREGPGGRDADGEHLRHKRRCRAGERRVRLPVGAERRKRRYGD